MSTKAHDSDERYAEELLPALQKEIGYTNPIEVPRLEKIVLNMGLGEAIQNAEAASTRRSRS